MSWVLRLSAVKEPARDAFRLVGAERDDRLVGMFGRKSIVRTECPDSADSDRVRLWPEVVSKYPVSLNFEGWGNGAELTDMLLFVRRLLVDLREGAFEDFVDDRRSGITTTGMPPLFNISRRDLP